MTSDAMLELILFVRKHGWQLELDRERIIMGGHDKFVVTMTTTTGATTSAAEGRVGGGKEDQEGKG